MDVKIPRTIYTFWSGERSIFVERCIARMRVVNPSYRVLVLGDTDVTYTPGLEALGAQHTSDWVRASYLLRHGGVWLDASCVCTTGVEDWVNHDDHRLQGFSAPWDTTVLENWALACIPGCPAMRKWHAELQRAIAMGFRAYKYDIDASVFDRRRLPYLTMHAAFCVTRPHIVGMYHMLPSTCTNTSACCPFGDLEMRHIFFWRWFGMIYTLLHTASPLRKCFIKVVGSDRDLISAFISLGAFRKSGSVAQILDLDEFHSQIEPSNHWWYVLAYVYIHRKPLIFFIIVCCVTVATLIQRCDR
jgi:hypothetical protein